jgi:hypothetical protein
MDQMEVTIPDGQEEAVRREEEREALERKLEESLNGTGGQIRNPKAEARKRSEGRNPKQMAFCSR